MRAVGRNSISFRKIVTARARKQAQRVSKRSSKETKWNPQSFEIFMVVTLRCWDEEGPTLQIFSSHVVNAIPTSSEFLAQLENNEKPWRRWRLCKFPNSQPIHPLAVFLINARISQESVKQPLCQGDSSGGTQRNFEDSKASCLWFWWFQSSSPTNRDKLLCTWMETYFKIKCTIFNYSFENGKVILKFSKFSMTFC